MPSIEFKRVDEDMPGIDDEINEIIGFLLSHREYLTPFSRILTNMPLNFVGNPRFTKELESYLTEEFSANEYFFENSFSQVEVKKLISVLTSYFAIYDDYKLQAFIKNNSRYKIQDSSPRGLQKEAFGRLKGYLFERLVCELLAPCYSGVGCLFETGCVIIINGVEVSVIHNCIHRRTMDVAGLNSVHAGKIIECKVSPIRINELAVKYGVLLKSRLESSGFAAVEVGFITAGAKNMVQLKISEQIKNLGISDPGLTAYDMNDIRIFSECS